jgi:hypothetical protein
VLSTEGDLKEHQWKAISAWIVGVLLTGLTPLVDATSENGEPGLLNGLSCLVVLWGLPLAQEFTAATLVGRLREEGQTEDISLRKGEELELLCYPDPANEITPPFPRSRCRFYQICSSDLS